MSAIVPDSFPLSHTSATITSGTALSAAVDLSGLGLGMILMSAAWTAAVLTAQVSRDNATFYSLYDATGTEWSATVAAGNAVMMDPAAFHSFRYLKLRSGTSGTPVNQGADRVLTLIVREF